MAKSELEGMLDYETGSGITSKIKKKIALWVREQAVMQRLGIADENAEKAWKTAQALDARLERMAQKISKSVSHLKDL
jgi:hypothetical protein